MSATLTSKSVTRTPPTLPTVPPTHIQSLVHKPTSLPPVPPIPSNIDPESSKTIITPEQH